VPQQKTPNCWSDNRFDVRVRSEGFAQEESKRDEEGGCDESVMRRVDATKA
jgi:hypothetical protein